MANTNNNDFPASFKLKKAGDSAVVRLCYSSVEKFETMATHWLQYGDTWKHVKCLGDNQACNACKAGVRRDENLYLYLYDYTDNTYKVWQRTPNRKFIDSIHEIEKTWGNLNTLAIKITRDSDEFPTYTVAVQPPQNYPIPKDFPIDKNIAYRFASNRSSDDIQAFLTTGVMPPKPPKNDSGTTSSQTTTNATPATNAPTAQNNAVVSDSKPNDEKKNAWYLSDDEELPF